MSYCRKYFSLRLVKMATSHDPKIMIKEDVVNKITDFKCYDKFDKKFHYFRKAIEIINFSPKWVYTRYDRTFTHVVYHLIEDSDKFSFPGPISNYKYCTDPSKARNSPYFLPFGSPYADQQHIQSFEHYNEK